MTFANAGTLDALPGQRDALVALLTRRSDRVAELGCLLYEVGVDVTAPDTVFVVELWASREAHRASLEDEAVRAAIAEARPLLAGSFGGFRFDVVSSPLRDWTPSLLTLLAAATALRRQEA